MSRPKGSKNKPKDVVISPKVVEPKRGRGRPKGMAIPPKPKVVVPKTKDDKVLPNVDFEHDVVDSDVKIIQCPYMGPDADDTEAYIRQQIVGGRKWNADDSYDDKFSISVDDLY